MMARMAGTIWIKLWGSLVLVLLLMSGRVEAAVRIVSATPNTVQLQPGKAATLSVRGSGLKTIRGGALYRDKAGRQKAGKLNVRYSGGVSSGRLTLTLAGRVKPGTYYIHLVDSRGARTGLPVRGSVGGAASAKKPAAKNNTRRTPVSQPLQAAQARSKPVAGKASPTGRSATNSAVSRVTGAGKPAKARSGTSLNVRSVSPRALRLHTGKAVTLSLRGTALNTIRRAALFTDSAGKTSVGSLKLRYMGGPTSGRLTLTATSKIKPGSYHVQLTDSHGKPFMLPVKATVQRVNGSKPVAKPRVAKQAVGSRKLSADARAKSAPRAAAPVALATRDSTNKPENTTQRSGKGASRRDKDQRNRERIARMGRAATGAPESKPADHKTPGLSGSARTSQNQTNTTQSAIAAVASMPGRRGSEMMGDKQTDRTQNRETGVFPSGTPLAQAESDSETTGTNPAQDIMADAKEQVDTTQRGSGGFLGGVANQADANQETRVDINFKDMTVAEAKKFAEYSELVADIAIGVAAGAAGKAAAAGAAAEAGAGAGAAAGAAAETVGKVTIAGKVIKLAGKFLDDAAKAYQDARDKEAMDKIEREGNDQDNQEGQCTEGAGQCAEEDNDQDNQEGQCTEGTGQCTEEENDQDNQSNKDGQCTEDVGGNGQCTENANQPSYTSADQGGPLSDWDKRQIARDAKRLQPVRTTRAGNQINVGRDGVERVDLSEARAVDARSMFGNPGNADNTATQVRGGAVSPPPQTGGDVDYQDAPYQSSGLRNDRDLMNIGTGPVNDSVAASASSSNAQRFSSASARSTTQAASTGVRDAANRLAAVRPATQVGSATAYGRLIAPSNACTALVRRVCGDRNQCSSRVGCPPAKQLLERYNEGGQPTDTEASCAASLEDGALFPPCDR